jgi:hypothetical protein
MRIRCSLGECYSLILSNSISFIWVNIGLYMKLIYYTGAVHKSQLQYELGLKRDER